MIINNEFLRALKGLLIVSLLTAVYVFLHAYFDTRGDNSETPYFYTSLKIFKRVIINAAFWIAVAYVTKEKRGAIIGFAIATGWVLLNFYLFNNADSYKEMREFRYWISKLLTLVSYAVFCIIYLKSVKGLYLGIIFFAAATGIAHAGSVFGLHEMLNGILRYIGLYDVFFVKKYLSETSYTEINIFTTLAGQIYNPLRFIIFWFLLNQFKKYKSTDFSLRTIDTHSNLSPFIFSVLFWLLRIALLVAVFGVMGNFENVSRFLGSIGALIMLLISFVGIFVVGSLYRNVITSYYVSRGKYPSWSYLLLGIPVISVVIWLYLLTKPAKAYTENNTTLESTEENIEDNQSHVSEKLLQEKFVRNDRNIGIKVLVIISILVSLFLQIGELNDMSYLVGTEYMILLGIMLFSGLSVVWYITDRTAMFILYAIYAVVIYFLVKEEYHYGMLFIAAGMINLLVNYPLFHFDQLKFDKKTEHTID